MSVVNNDWYEDLDARWYDDDAHAIALLRAEAPAKLAYVRDVFADHGIGPNARVLDVACGAGFLSIPLASGGYAVKGVDRSASSIRVAREHADPNTRITFEVGDAYALAEAPDSYDAVLLLDFLEHVDRPEDVVAQAAHVLKPGGLLVFHTFNRTPLGYLIGVKGPALMVRDVPTALHVYERFVRPAELRAMCAECGLQMQQMRGLRPKLESRAFWLSLLRRRVHPGLGFAYTTSLAAGYLGYALKVAHERPGARP